MPLPPVLEICPPSGVVHSRITIPGSKSITNRALVLAALAKGPVTLQGALWSEDTRHMVNCLGVLGIDLSLISDPNEPGNRNITVAAGSLRPGGSSDRPLDLFVGNSGTTARFLAALVCLGEGAYRIAGTPRMHERPQASLFDALRQLGYRVDSPNGRLPAVIYGSGPKPEARCSVAVEESSQFASALLLCAKAGGWRVSVLGEDADESAYVRMTADLAASFPETGEFQIEADASSASYFWAAAWILRNPGIGIAKRPESALQVDARFPSVLDRFPDRLSRESDLGDSIMTAICLAPFTEAPKTFRDLGRLRLQECERVAALRTELQKCGAAVVEKGDTLTVVPGPLHGASIETYDDHRMAMCFSVVGMAVPGIRIQNPGCVKKTFPNFFQKLAGIPPAGLGMTLLDEGGAPVPFEALAEE